MTELLENSPVSAGEDDVRHYLNEIRRYPRLTPEEERELAMRCARGDESATVSYTHLDVYKRQICMTAALISTACTSAACTTPRKTAPT